MLSGRARSDGCGCCRVEVRYSFGSALPSLRRLGISPLPAPNRLDSETADSDSGPRCHAMYVAASVARSISIEASDLGKASRRPPQIIDASATQCSFSQWASAILEAAGRSSRSRTATKPDMTRLASSSPRKFAQALFRGRLGIKVEFRIEQVVPSEIDSGRGCKDMNVARPPLPWLSRQGCGDGLQILPVDALRPRRPVGSSDLPFDRRDLEISSSIDSSSELPFATSTAALRSMAGDTVGGSAEPQEIAPCSGVDSAVASQRAQTLPTFLRDPVRWDTSPSDMSKRRWPAIHVFLCAGGEQHMFQKRCSEGPLFSRKHRDQPARLTTTSCPRCSFSPPIQFQTRSGWIEELDSRTCATMRLMNLVTYHFALKWAFSINGRAISTRASSHAASRSVSISLKRLSGTYLCSRCSSCGFWVGESPK